jgi:hypothetical protein
MVVLTTLTQCSSAVQGLIVDTLSMLQQCIIVAIAVM